MCGKTEELYKSRENYLLRQIQRKTYPVQCDLCDNIQNINYRFTSKKWPEQWRCNNCGRTHNFEVKI